VGEKKIPGVRRQKNAGPPYPKRGKRPGGFVRFILAAGALRYEVAVFFQPFVPCHYEVVRQVSVKFVRLVLFAVNRASGTLVIAVQSIT
jgi:hypothetical protein